MVDLHAHGVELPIRDRTTLDQRECHDGLRAGLTRRQRGGVVSALIQGGTQDVLRGVTLVRTQIHWIETEAIGLPLASGTPIDHLALLRGDADGVHGAFELTDLDRALVLDLRLTRLTPSDHDNASGNFHAASTEPPIHLDRQHDGGHVAFGAVTVRVGQGPEHVRNLLSHLIRETVGVLAGESVVELVLTFESTLVDLLGVAIPLDDGVDVNTLTRAITDGRPAASAVFGWQVGVSLVQDISPGVTGRPLRHHLLRAHQRCGACVEALLEVLDGGDVDLHLRVVRPVDALQDQRLLLLGGILDGDRRSDGPRGQLGVQREGHEEQHSGTDPGDDREDTVEHATTVESGHLISIDLAVEAVAIARDGVVAPVGRDGETEASHDEPEHLSATRADRQHQTLCALNAVARLRPQ